MVPDEPLTEISEILYKYHIPCTGDIFDFHPSRKCNIFFIIPNRKLDHLFSEILPLLNRPIMVRGDPKGK